MEKSIVIDVGTTYSRAAIYEEDELVNVYLENQYKEQIQGAIYQGRIANIVKGMKAAFIDIGAFKNAFLHYEDIPEELKGRLQNNQRMAVQVVKEAGGNKGPKVTAFINIIGKYMVLLPFEHTIGISRKIENEQDRNRLKKIICKSNPQKLGVIIRTSALGATDEQLSSELEGLIEKWEAIQQKSIGASGGTILYEEPSLAIKIVREHANDSVQEIVINNEEEGLKIQQFLAEHMAGLEKKVRIVSNVTDLYGAYNIDKEIEKALKKQIWLKSGANIIIEKTEAMNIIDVNSAKFVTIKQKDKMILKTNLQAAKESARQIRIRNLSGMILIDFIDMNEEEHKIQLVELLQAELGKDKIRAKVYPITELGIVQITRQKKHLSLQEQMMQKCHCCNEPYKYMSYDYLFIYIEKRIREIVRESIHRDIIITAEQDMIQYIKKNATIQKSVERTYGVHIELIIDVTMQKNQYEITVNHNKVL